jgi:hypothetical protein
MKTLAGIVSVGSLFLAAALLPIVGGVLFAAFLFGAFLLALVGVLGGLDDRSVRQHEPSMDGSRWRAGSGESPR